MIDVKDAQEVWGRSRPLPTLVVELLGLGYPRRSVLRWYRARMGVRMPVSTRAELLKALRGGPRTTREIADALDLSPENAAMRLRLAEKAGLVKHSVLPRVRSGRPRFAWTLKAAT